MCPHTGHVCVPTWIRAFHLWLDRVARKRAAITLVGRWWKRRTSYGAPAYGPSRLTDEGSRRDDEIAFLHTALVNIRV